MARFDEDAGPRQGVFEDIAAALAELPPEAYAPRPPQTARQPRRLADALAASVLAAGGMLLPPSPRLALASAMAAPVLLRGVDSLASRGLKAKSLDMASVGFALATGDSSSALGICAMVVVGEYLRQATEDKAGALLRTLLAPPVGTVRVERPDANGRPQELQLAAEALRPGDLVLVGTGEMLAVDGLAVRGEALVDKGVISGESAPVEAVPGDEVPAGAVLAHGSLAVRALRTGAECATARIAALMDKSLREKSRPERLSDRLADRLAPLSLAFGAGIYAATGSASRALSVLTVDYACAVKLSAPVVVKATMHAAARAGILLKGGSPLDELARADTIVFDKTGTLTTGRMTVADIVLAPGCGLDEDGLIRLAASAEERWTHPVARALAAEARRRGLALLPACEADCATGLGARALVGEADLRRDVAVGSGRFLTRTCGQGALCTGDAALRAQGKTVVHVAVDGRPAGIVALRDELRPEAGEVIAALRRRGVRRVLLLTGDHPDAAAAALAGLSGPCAPDEVRAGLTPDDKEKAVRELRRSGSRVAVVGDGVNDAPALLAGDVGVCVAGDELGGGTVAALTRDAAGIVLLSGGLRGLLAARQAAERAGRVLRGCFATGVAVNSALLVAAASGKISPLAAAALHNGTTFAILSAAGLAAGRPLPAPGPEQGPDRGGKG